MNFSEYRNRLGADPGSQDPEFLAARRAGPEFEAAARESEVFERKLEGVARFPVDADALLAELLHTPRRAATPRWLAMAAGIAVLAGITAILLSQSRVPDTLPEYLAAHYQHDGQMVLERAIAGAASDPRAVLARFKLAAAPALAERIAYIKLCPSPHGEGAHMVVQTTDGLVTVFFLPGVRAEPGLVVPVDGQRALLVDLPGGSGVIIGTRGQQEAQLALLLQEALLPMPVDA